MNIVPLFTQEGKEVAWVCGNCKIVHGSKERAEECCKPLICEKCGREISQDRNKCREVYYLNPLRCSDCYRKDKEKEVPVISEDEYLQLCKEDDSMGPVFWDDNGYEDLYQALECELTDYDTIEDVPDEIYLGQWQKMDKINIEDIIYNKVEEVSGDNFEPDDDDVYEDVKELYDFVDKWNAKQTHYKYYTQINKKVKIKPETIKEYWGEE